LYYRELSVSFMIRPMHTKGRSLGSQWAGGLVGPIAGVDTIPKIKINTCEIRRTQILHLAACYYEYYV
jgi:hypothetical protein